MLGVDIQTVNESSLAHAKQFVDLMDCYSRDDAAGFVFGEGN